MSNLTCIICTDLLSQNHNIFVTKCGHIFHYECLSQWLRRSASCPQCRIYCTTTSIHRVFLNLGDENTSKIRSLQEKLDNANLLAQVSEIDLRQAEEKVKNLNASQIKYMKTISILEQKVKNYDSLTLSFNNQLTALSKKASQRDSLSKEVESMKDQMTKMKDIQSILASTSKDAEKLLKKEKNPTKLALWVSALKREKEERLSQLESENNSLTAKENRDAKVKANEKNLVKAKKQIKNLKAQLKKCKESDSSSEQNNNEQSQNKEDNISVYVKKLKLEQQNLKLSEAKRVELEKSIQSAADELQDEIDLTEKQRKIISDLRYEIERANDHLRWFLQREINAKVTRKVLVEPESRFGGFRIGMLVVGVIVVFCIYGRN